MEPIIYHETSAQFLSSCFNIVCEERAVYICLSTYPVPCYSTQLKLWHSFTHKGPRLHIVGGWPVVAYRGLCTQSQTYQVHNPGEGVILVANQRLPLASMRFDYSQHQVSC